MTGSATTNNVWKAINNQLFAVLAMVTHENESRSVGIVYIVQDRKLYIGTETESWKAKHIKNNPNVSITIPVPKRIPLFPWIKIPQATISFSGTARVFPALAADKELLRAVYRHFADDQELLAKNSIIEVSPVDEFITYGINIPIMKMMKPELARGRAAVE